MIDWMKIYKKNILRLFLQLKMPEYLINAPFESIYHTVHYILQYYTYRSLEIGGLCLMKCPSEILQNLPYFYHMKTHIVFFCFSFRATLFFPLMNALVYVDIDLHEMKNGKSNFGFSYV